ncbi:hypothetical protein Tco_1540305 [Tanacetum coccineum]
MAWCQSRCSGRHVCVAEDIKEPNELFRDDTLPRPPGKPMHSKSQKFDSSKSAGSSSTGKEAFKDIVQEKLRTERAKKFDFIDTKKIRGIKVSYFSAEGMKPKNAANIEKLKDEIRAKYFGSSYRHMFIEAVDEILEMVFHVFFAAISLFKRNQGVVLYHLIAAMVMIGHKKSERSRSHKGLLRSIVACDQYESLYPQQRELETHECYFYILEEEEVE